MEVTGAVFGQVPCFKDSVHGLKQHKMMMFGRTRVRCCDNNGFSDKSHVEYYNGGGTMVKDDLKIKVKEEKKELKKKMKMLKGLSKNLGMFSDMGFGLNVDGDVELDDRVKGQMISEATDVLVAQLQKLKGEKMESKRIKKEEKAKKKAAKMMMEGKDSNSSESSSSSESDCDNVMNMKEMKTKKTSNTCQETPLSLALPVQIYEKVENKVTENAMLKDLTLVEEGSKKIEVCMGGKCKKSGAAMLMENFQRAVGEEVAVVGCKCMGKCRDGPNVRVRSEDDAMANPLCVGVGLEDVDTIVTNFFGESHSSCSVMVPALSSV